MAAIKATDIQEAKEETLRAWNENETGNSYPGGPSSSMYKETIPGGIRSLSRKHVLVDANNIYYAFATSYFETDENGWQNWAEVKASLRKYFVDAIADANHERHILYIDMQTKSKWKLPNGLEGSLLKSLHTNDWTPESFTPYSIFQVMADYYDVEIVVFQTRLWTRNNLADQDGTIQPVKRVSKEIKDIIKAQNLAYQDFDFDLENRDDPAVVPLAKPNPVCYGLQNRRQIFLWATSGRYGGFINVGTPSWPVNCAFTKWDEDRVMQYQNMVDTGILEDYELWNPIRTAPCEDRNTFPTAQEIAQVVSGVNVAFQDITVEQAAEVKNRIR